MMNVDPPTVVSATRDTAVTTGVLYEYGKGVALLLPPTVTNTGNAAPAPEGNKQTIFTWLVTTGVVQGSALTDTVTEPPEGPKLVPVIVILVVPSVAPVAGVIDVIVGAE
jgi:hypothetical protein